MFKTLLTKFKNYKIQKLPERFARSGFTMIELMVVIAIVVSLSVTSFIAFSNVSSSKAVKNGLDEMEALITAARRKSISQENGARWGVRTENTTTSKRMVLFSGVSYASGTPSNYYSLKRNVVFTNPVASTTYDVLFDPITGFLSEKKVITVATLKRDGIVGDLVLNTIGAVTKRYDYGVVGYWHFDEGTGTIAYDASGRGNNGTLTNGPTWQVSTNCKAGMCLNFDGTDDYISTSSIPNLTSEFSFSVWAKTPILQDSTYDTIISKFSSSPYNGWFLRHSPNTNAIYFSFYNAGSSYSVSTSALTANTWIHYVGTFDGSNMKLYTNGLLSGTQVGSVGSATTNFAIGGNYGGPSETWNGSIDEVRVYNRALSASEILAMYNDLK
ncbi:MAG: hypothetical protein LiPW41_245 [Parcubacteria group bacterium LiPW_41]|nr:MAG: hypothetical protein LiPW41_245 [Parcubacteria group bacterium LiPW_41]